MEVAGLFCAQNPGVKALDLLPNVVRGNGALRPGFYPRGMLPRGANNNADAIVEWADGSKWVADFKLMQGNGGKLKERLYDAYQQADYAIVKVAGDIKDVKKLVETAERFMKGHSEFKGLYIYDRGGNEIWTPYFVHVLSTCLFPCSIFRADFGPFSGVRRRRFRGDFEGRLNGV